MMLFRGAPANRITRLFASLVVVAMGAPLIVFRNTTLLLMGLAFCAIGLGAAAWQGIQMWRERPDPYDLTRLWDDPPLEPEETNHVRDMIYCHRCGSSMSEVHSVCPQCGSPLGS